MGKDKDDGSHLVGGAILIVLGLIFLGSELDLLPWWSMGRLWPVILITIGAVRVIVPERPGNRGGAVWLLFVGGVFVLHNYDVLSLQDSWPLFIVVAGVSILMGARAADRRRLNEPAEGHHDG
jgi:hypothetical protein